MTLINVPVVYLYYPWDTPSIFCILPSPEFNNTHELSCRRIQRKTRGLDQKTFADSAWSQSEVFTVNFEAMHKNRVSEVRAFVKASLGKYIKYIDYESREWKCLMTDVHLPSVNSSSDCGYSVSFTLEGVLIV